MDVSKGQLSLSSLETESWRAKTETFAHVQRRDDVNEGQRMMKKLPHRRKKEKLREDSWM